MLGRFRRQLAWLLGVFLVLALVSASGRPAAAEAPIPSDPSATATVTPEPTETPTPTETVVAPTYNDVYENARMAAIESTPMGGDPKSYDAKAWELATYYNVPFAYGQYAAGWAKGVDYVNHYITTFEGGALQYETTDKDRPNASQKAAQLRYMAAIWQNEVLPMAKANALAAANRVATLFADFAVVDGVVVVTPKASNAVVVTMVEGSQRVTDDGKRQVDITLTDSTGQYSPVAITWTEGADEFKQYTMPTNTSVAKATVTTGGDKVADSSQVWTGGQVRPAIQVAVDGITLQEGVDYTLTYGSNSSIGKGTVTVTGIGTYAGTEQVVTFKIVPKATKATKLKAGKKSVRVYVTKAAKAQKVTKAVVQYRRVGTTSWKSKTFSAKASSVKITKLKKGKTYQFRVAVYKTVSGTKYYSPWSAVKTKKTKR